MGMKKKKKKKKKKKQKNKKKRQTDGSGGHLDIKTPRNPASLGAGYPQGRTNILS